MGILAFIFGSIIGSFLTVCIYRIPYGREPESLSTQEELESEHDIATEPATSEEQKLSVCHPSRSFCPHCQAQLHWYHNIPIISWLMLRGRCSFCQARISIRYPLVEVISGSLAYFSYATFGLNATGLVIYAFCASLIVISFIDYDYFIIPNVISLPGTLIALALVVLNQFLHIFSAPIATDLREAFWGFMAGAGFLFIVSEGYLRLRKREGLGMGDVKLLAMTGVLFGVPGSLYTIFLGSLFGSLIGLALILTFGRKMSQQLPFGPYLALGTLTYLFVGPEIIMQYLGKLLGLGQ
ncbi:MAG: prepilin peptidase [Oligoflexia bacterium]|nr:prepilin peptidase [Oligoflexia bacterium]